MRRSSFLPVVAVLCGFAASAWAQEGDSRVIVGFKGTPDAALLAGRGVKVSSVHGRFAVGRVAAAKIAKLRQEPVVQYVEEDGIASTSGQMTPTGVAEVWGGSPPAQTGAGVKVAIIDTGIDLTHPDLAPNIAGGVTFVYGTTSPNDDNGHGTHVSGTVAAVNDGGGVVGVAPGAKLYAVKVLDKNGSGYVSDIAKGVDWARTNQMQIANMSFGSSTYSSTLYNACNNAYAGGVLLVAAAGNSGDGNVRTTETSYPAAYSVVCAVGAVDGADQVASFSNTGGYVEMSAPGVNVVSTYKGGQYAQMSGTSMACPHVVGLAALLWGANPTFSQGQIHALLRTNVRDVNGDGWDPGYGYGVASLRR